MRSKLISDGKPKSVEVNGETYYYRNGSVKMHNTIMGLMGDKSKRQQAFAKAVQFLMTDEKGKPEFSVNSTEDFNLLIDPEKADHNLIRELGMQFMGMSADDETDEFSQLLEDETKNGQATAAPGSS